ncbi:MAG: cell envelope integrity protein TolA, partial [Verrucomicrobiota bacterium]
LRDDKTTGHMPSNLSMSAVGDKLFAALAGGSSGTSIYLPTNIRSSGNSVVDQSVLQAVQSVTQLEALPSDYRKAFKDITVDFELNL